MAYEQAVEITKAVLTGDHGRTAVLVEGDGSHYALVRYYDSTHPYGPSGRLRFWARVTVDRLTGDMLELRGDYQDDEIERIERIRPPGTMPPQAAIQVASEHFEKVRARSSGARGPAPQPSRQEIDLIGGRYYMIRFPNPPLKPGAFGTYYRLLMVIDGKTGDVLSAIAGV